MQATQRRHILLMSPAVYSWGILLHSSCKAAPKAWSVLGRGTLCHTCWPRMYQTCSIGDKSGDPDPHCSANRACLGHSRPACMTESSTTKNAPSFGRSLAGGVEEDTPAHQEYALLCGLHRWRRKQQVDIRDIDRFVRFYW